MTQLLLRLLRVPPEPHPPAGSPDSIRIFRAAPNYYYWILLYWMLGQMAAGAILVVLVSLQPEQALPWLQSAIHALQLLAVFIFAVQLFITYWKQRLDFDMRWYMVTDRSLRIRSGIFTVQEMTMTFANLQKIAIEQGPLEKLLGIATVTVSSAGGGAPQPGKAQPRGQHSARFEGVNNAQAIRDLILERLRRYRDSGLGDPDDHTAPAELGAAVLDAAREVLQEARGIRCNPS